MQVEEVPGAVATTSGAETALQLQGTDCLWPLPARGEWAGALMLIGEKTKKMRAARVETTLLMDTQSPGWWRKLFTVALPCCVSFCICIVIV